jgi:hypothetical protein
MHFGSVMSNVIMLNVIMPNVILLNVIMLNVIMLNVIMLNVIMVNVVMLNVVAPSGKPDIPIFLLHYWGLPVIIPVAWVQCYKTFYDRK